MNEPNAITIYLEPGEPDTLEHRAKVEREFRSTMPTWTGLVIVRKRPTIQSLTKD